MIRSKRVGRPRAIRAPHTPPDEIEDMEDQPAATGRPKRSNVEVNMSIIQGVLARRAGSISEQVDALLRRNFPSNSAQTAEAIDAIRTWLANPTRSRMPTEETFAQRPKRKKSSAKKRW